MTLTQLHVVCATVTGSEAQRSRDRKTSDRQARGGWGGLEAAWSRGLFPGGSDGTLSVCCPSDRLGRWSTGLPLGLPPLILSYKRRKERRM